MITIKMETKMNKKNQFMLSAIALSVLTSTVATAAERTNLRNNYQQLSSISSVTALTTSQSLGLATNESLSVVKTYVETNGDVTTRYQQMFNGIPVIGDHAIISRHTDGSFKYAHGAIVNGIATDLSNTSPKVTLDGALKKAKMLSLPNDPWGNPYLLLSPGENGAVDIFSIGLDGEEGTDDDIGNWNMHETDEDNS